MHNNWKSNWKNANSIERELWYWLDEDINENENENNIVGGNEKRIENNNLFCGTNIKENNILRETKYEIKRNPELIINKEPNKKIKELIINKNQESNINKNQESNIKKTEELKLNNNEMKDMKIERLKKGLEILSSKINTPFVNIIMIVIILITINTIIKIFSTLFLLA